MEASEIIGYLIGLVGVAMVFGANWLVDHVGGLIMLPLQPVEQEFPIWIIIGLALAVVGLILILYGRMKR